MARVGRNPASSGHAWADSWRRREALERHAHLLSISLWDTDQSARGVPNSEAFLVSDSPVQVKFRSAGGPGQSWSWQKGRPCQQRPSWQGPGQQVGQCIGTCRGLPYPSLAEPRPKRLQAQPAHPCAHRTPVGGEPPIHARCLGLPGAQTVSLVPRCPHRRRGVFEGHHRVKE